MTTSERTPAASPFGAHQYSDGHVIVLMRGLRSFAYGMLAVVLAIALTGWGFSPAEIGVLVALSLAGDFFGTLLIGHRADRWGRRRTLVLLAVLMALTGVIFGLLHWYPLLVLAAFVGTLGTSASETAPFLPIEQAILGQLGNGTRGTTLFARYNLVAYLAGAGGALLAALPAIMVRRGIPLKTGLLLLFGLYVLVALIVAALATDLSSSVEADVPPQPHAQDSSTAAGDGAGSAWHRLLPPVPSSQAIVTRLAALFGVDAFAGGLIGQTLLALFFHLRFGAGLATLGVLFFGANLLSALSILAAPRLARRFGLLNTMVFTHLLSNVFLILVALMPTFPLAATLLLLRQTLSQLDIPTRQAYTMALVVPAERTAAASTTSLARSAGSATSPLLAGMLLQLPGPLIVLGLPLLLAGGLKAAYDLALWRTFRLVQLPADSTLSLPPGSTRS